MTDYRRRQSTASPFSRRAGEGVMRSMTDEGREFAAQRGVQLRRPHPTFADAKATFSREAGEGYVTPSPPRISAPAPPSAHHPPPSSRPPAPAPPTTASSTRSSQMNSSCWRASSGMSSKSFRLRAGSMTRLMPARCAAIDLLLDAADREHEPAQADLAGHGGVACESVRSVISETSAMNIATPALGPSFGVAPAGT